MKQFEEVGEVAVDSDIDLVQPVTIYVALLLQRGFIVATYILAAGVDACFMVESYIVVGLEL